MERLKNLFELKITAGNVLTIIILLLAGYEGYVELKANHNNLDREFREHTTYDDKRFELLATKESRDMRDRWVDQQLREILERVKNIESAHITNGNGRSK